MCSDNTGSSQRSKDKKQTSDFPWQNVLQEVKEHCSTLVGILQTCTVTKSKRNNAHIICAIVCMLCTFRWSNMSLFQRLISTILYAGHTGTVHGKYIDPF